MKKLFSIFFKRKEVKKDKYKVVECKTEHGIHYEIWKNGSPQYTEWNTKFGKRMMTEKWNSYRMACRALQNMHYNDGIVELYKERFGL
jgi:hypothetical protein